ncbi:MAG: acyl-CoA synthetase [Pseudomonadota bacterium]
MAQDAAPRAIEFNVLETPAEIAAFAETPLAERYAPRTTLEMLADGAAQHGGSPAVTFQLTPDPEAGLAVTTYAELQDEARKFANAAFAAGAPLGARVAILLPNAPEAVFAIFGAHYIGAAAPVNPLLEPEIITAILNAMEAEILVTLAPTPGSDLAEKAAAAVAGAPSVKTVVEVNLLAYLGVPGPTETGRKMAHADLVDYRAFTGEARADGLDFERSVGPDDLCALFHSGGTTGAPKLVRHLHRAVIANCAIANSMLSLGGVAGGPQPVVLSCLPLFHVFAAYALLTGPLSAGCNVVLCTPAGYRTPGLLENFWKIVARHGAHVLAAVPTAVSALDQIPVDADVSTVGMLISGGSALPAPLAQRFTEKTGVRICEGYGMTETIATLCFNPHVGGPKTGSVGFVAPYITLRIAQFDDQDRWIRDCGLDEIGEVCVSGPNVFPGYLEERRNEGLFFETAEGPQGRFFRTGDLGRVDPDGFVWLTGRAKDLIIRGGHNIDPGMIEDALVSHPEVAFVGAIGQPDASKGELPCAYVELVEGGRVTEAALMAHVEERVAERAARPVYIEVMAELPKTAVGKVFKPALRDAATARVCAAALHGAGFKDAAVTVEADATHGTTVVVSGVAGADADIAAAMDGLARSWRRAA